MSAADLDYHCPLERRGDAMVCPRCGRTVRVPIGWDAPKAACARPAAASGCVEPPRPGADPEFSSLAEEVDYAGGACVHRGQVLRLAPCGVCGERDRRAEVYACAIHAECTLRFRGVEREKPGRGKVHACAGCRDGRRPTPPGS